MTMQSDHWRQRAAEDRAAADRELLPNTKTQLLASAQKLDEIAEQAERLEKLKAASQDHGRR